MILIQEHSYSEHPNIYIPWCSDIRTKYITDTPAYQQKSGVPEDVTVVPFFSDLNLKWEEDDTAESYVIYIDDQKVGETEELSYHVTGLDYNTSYSVSVASVYSDGSEVKADPEPTKTGNIQQITRNVGPTHLSVNWDGLTR